MYPAALTTATVAAVTLSELIDTVSVTPCERVPAGPPSTPATKPTPAILPSPDSITMYPTVSSARLVDGDSPTDRPVRSDPDVGPSDFDAPRAKNTWKASSFDVWI